MKGKISLSVWSILAATLSIIIGGLNLPAEASPRRNITCQRVSGAWTTVVTDSRGERQLIRWVSDFGHRVGYTPEQRCLEVSNRMRDNFGREGQYITHGRMNGQNVICQTDRLGEDCQQLLYTLKPEDDPKTKLEDLFQLNNPNVSRGPLREPPCPTYISVDALMDGKTLIAEEVCSSQSALEESFLTPIVQGVKAIFRVSFK
jgi:hypothetical protein